ncbi:MAG: 50S ribosomal protein L22 [Planctomycetes bacterium]|nr:50S ribosomal protein L22 [Planctomycetota bacterium]
MSAQEFIAKHRFARITARKAGRIADLIRGRDVNEALELLHFTPNRGASFYEKVVKSAVANASLDENVNVNRLFVCDARADIGPLLNNRLRFRPGPQGRAMPFAKRLSHLTIKVKEREDAPEKQSKSKGKKAASKSGAKSSTQAKSTEAPAKKAAPKTKAKQKSTEGDEK